MPRQPRTSKRGKKVEEQENVCGSDISVPYAIGFKPPSEIQRKNAIGFGKEIPTEFERECTEDGFEFFKPIPRPASIDDWLAQYCEVGQTYKQFMSQCPWLSSRKRKYMSQEFASSGQSIKDKYPDGKIYIVPVGDFEEVGYNFYASLLKYTEIFLGLPVVSLPKIKLEESKDKIFWVEDAVKPPTDRRRISERTKRHELNSRYNPETGHRQMCVDSSLMQLRKFIPRDALCMIGLTMTDLYGDDTDLFVAGMAAGNQRVAIFSLYRYDPCLSFSSENWYQVEQSVNMAKKDRQQTTLHRGCKLLVHEICHLLGIDHCIFYDCCMNGSGHLQEDFRQSMHLCPVDLRKLFTLVGFNILERYKSLLQFCKEHGFKEEAEWIERRIKYICSTD